MNPLPGAQPPREPEPTRPPLRLVRAEEPDAWDELAEEDKRELRAWAGHAKP